MPRTRLLALAPLALMLAAGCGTARVVNRSQSGGVIALEGDRNKATEEANRLMAEHCAGPYQVLEEGEHVVGQDTAAGSETYVADDGTVVEEQGESTREATEWRIRYGCGNQAPSAAPGDDGGGAPPDDQGGPPDDQGSAPPPPDDMGAPPDDQGSAPPPPDDMGGDGS